MKRKTQTSMYPSSPYRSRTFLLALIWSIFVPMGLIAASIMSRYGIHSEGWLTSLTGGAAAIVTAFVGVEKWRKAKRETEEAKRGG
jgi:hypothetical protein